MTLDRDPRTCRLLHSGSHALLFVCAPSTSDGCPHQILLVRKFSSLEQTLNRKQYSLRRELMYIFGYAYEINIAGGDPILENPVLCAARRVGDRR